MQVIFTLEYLYSPGRRNLQGNFVELCWCFRTPCIAIYTLLRVEIFQPYFQEHTIAVIGFSKDRISDVVLAKSKSTFISLRWKGTVQYLICPSLLIWRTIAGQKRWESIGSQCCTVFSLNTTVLFQFGRIFILSSSLRQLLAAQIELWLFGCLEGLHADWRSWSTVLVERSNIVDRTLLSSFISISWTVFG